MPIVAVCDAAFVPPGVLHVGPEASAVIDLVAGLDPADPVVLVSQASAGTLAARSARLALGDPRVGLLSHEVPGTAFFLAAAALRLLPNSALSLASCTAALAAHTTSTRALLSSVSTLVRPTPSFGDHVRSLWPSSRFVVSWGEDTVVPGRRIEPVPGVVTVVARSARSWADLDESAWAGETVELPQAQGAPAWASARWVEVSTLREGLDTVIRAVTDPAATRDFPHCRSCERMGWAGLCVFCQLPVGDEAAGTPILSPASQGGLQ